MTSSSKRPWVGVGVLVQKNGKYLFGKRIVKHGNNTWSVPGGHLEHGETFEVCAYREVLEETGVKIKHIKFITAVNNIFDDEAHHSITIFMKADWDFGEIRTHEPDKFVDIGWYSLDKLPQPLFLPVQMLQKQKPKLFSK